MSKFQIILMVVFGAFMVIAVIVFSSYRGASGGDVKITIWGDIPSFDFNQLLNTPAFSSNKTFSLNYKEITVSSIDAEFTEALARDAGPDLIILTQDRFLENKPKLLVIPYENYSEREFKNTFLEEGELFLDSTGVYALPLLIDPMVLYYNRDMLSSAGRANPISYWDEIYASAADMSKKDIAGNLISSVMALGESRNISHAKDILSLLMLQAGTPITGFVGEDLKVLISERFNLPAVPGEAALEFYTQFSNPAKIFYSWNRSLLDAQTHFASGDSAYYLGFASEYRILKNKSPNLNFGVSLVPQSRVSSRVITFGNLRGIAVSRGSKNSAVAFEVAKQLTSQDSAKLLSEALLLPPTRRDLLARRPTDAVLSVFYEAALQSRAWLDPSDKQTDGIFREAIESVTSGRARVLEAIGKMNRDLDAIIRQR